MNNSFSTKSLGFIGGGRVTRILLEGRCRAGAWPARIVVSDPSEAALAKLKGRFPIVEPALGANAEAAAQDIVLLALHSQAIPAVASEIKSHLKGSAILVSLAPKVTIATLAGLLGGFHRLVRFIPNAPAAVNVGFNPIVFSPTLSDADKLGVAQLCACWGCCPQVLEDKLEAYAILTGLGPSYFAFQLYELRNLAQSFGLTMAEAQLGLDRLFIGLLRMMAESSLSPEDVQDLVPVRPLREVEGPLLDAYRSKLTALLRDP